MTLTPLLLDGDTLAFLDCARFLAQRPPLGLADSARQRCTASRAVVEQAVAGERVVYGITTGFGKLSSVQIPAGKLGELQRNLVRSHAAGVGEPLSEEVALLTALLKANSLAKGVSGVRPEVIDHLCAIINAGAIPLLPSQGSVGASGDLAPLAHLALVLIGDPAGAVLWEGRRLSADQFLTAAGLAPLVLEAKEGLSILNGTQVSCALALWALQQAAQLMEAAEVCCALSIEAFQGSRVPFDPRIQQVRGQAGQARSAARVWSLLDNSSILDSHANCGKVQDPYAFRCAPQVHGTCRDALGFVRTLLERELNAATDNPLVFAGDGAILSGGNFHAEPCAFAADILTIAITELASISERRTAQLMDPAVSGLPAFLIEGSGLHSGLMLAQVTAAALVSENKTLSHPAVVDTIPTSAGKEDHVSMAPWAGRKALQAVTNCAHVLAIELLSACQGIEFHRPLTTSEALEQVIAQVRGQVAPLTADRPLAPDIAALVPLVMSGLG